jgi:serine phosphatase RsbU (regulator of sigma subunit)
VGGDYYDFVGLGAGRLGLVVADISGKGIAGALLMANLQANLRSHYASGAADVPRLLKSVNQLFYDSTADNQYATLFFAEYDDATRRLRYANCGHFPPILIRASGRVERLMPTAMVLGLFERWESPTEEIQLCPGDVLAIYTDGVLEATRGEDEFGADLLLDTVLANRERPAAEIVAAVHSAVQTFSAGSPSDDLTVVVARVR